jgi:predicted AlkP superfamily pyrophosphatase or phosphodiesterase
MKKLILLFSIFIMGACHPIQSQYKVDRPKLVVGIVVDQMRYDYLTRFYPKYGEGGFKRLLNEGFSCENSHYNYIPTYTAVGHASIYTGTTGSTHGIISNYWYDKFERKSIYCVDDFNYPAVGTTSAAEQKSPYRMLTTTVTDELRLSQNMKGKTIAVGIKDRSAVLPGGHSSNGSYWFHGMEEGNFVTSAYYMEALPKWVSQFNESGLKERYMAMKWETLYPIEEYSESIEDDNIYENPFEGEVKPVFPHDLHELKDLNGGYDLIKTTPFGNSLVMEFAKAAVEGEELGKRGYTDFLAISFSSPDYIGHRFGVDSKEVQDTYLRLDRDLAELLSFLDQKVGKGEYTVFLTADHAAVQVPAYLKSKKIPAGYFDEAAFGNFIREHCTSKWGSSEIVEDISNFQIFLKPEKLNELKLSKEEVSKDLVDLIINYEGVNKALTAMTLQRTEFTYGILSRLQKGYNQKLSGDVLWIPDPAVISYSHHGSTHGSGYSYDTHVPVMFYGKGIKRGVTHEAVEIIDIAPTISSLLKISFPNGSSGRVIESALK